MSVPGDRTRPRRAAVEEWGILSDGGHIAARGPRNCLGGVPAGYRASRTGMWSSMHRVTGLT
jgi:hypothetical protein